MTITDLNVPSSRSMIKQGRRKKRLRFDDLVLCRAMRALPESESAKDGKDEDGERRIFYWTKNAVGVIQKICADMAAELDDDEHGYLRNTVSFAGYRACGRFIAWVDYDYGWIPELPIYITAKFARTTHTHRVHVLVHEMIHATKREGGEYDHPESFKKSAVFPFGVFAGSIAHAYNPCDKPPSTRKELKDYYGAEYDDMFDRIELPVEFCDLILFKAIRTIPERKEEQSVEEWAGEAIETIDKLCLEYADRLGPEYAFLREKVVYLGNANVRNRKMTVVYSRDGYHTPFGAEIQTTSNFRGSHAGQVNLLALAVLQAKAGVGTDLTSYQIFPFGLYAGGNAAYDHDECAMRPKGWTPTLRELATYFQAGEDRPEYRWIRTR